MLPETFWQVFIFFFPWPLKPRVDDDRSPEDPRIWSRTMKSSTLTCTSKKIFSYRHLVLPWVVKRSSLYSQWDYLRRNGKVKIMERLIILKYWIPRLPFKKINSLTNSFFSDFCTWRHSHKILNHFFLLTEPTDLGGTLCRFSLLVPFS